MSGATPAHRAPDPQAGGRPTRARLLALLVRPTPPPLWLGIVVAVFFIAAESLAVHLLMAVAPGNTFGALYLFGVLIVSARWGFGLSAMTTLASTIAYGYVHFEDEGGFHTNEVEGWVAVLLFLPLATLANVLAGQARLQTADADQRRREAEASRDANRILADQQAALRRIATLVARGVPPAEVFSAVARELAWCLCVSHATLGRYEPDGSFILLAVHHEQAAGKEMLQIGRRFSLNGENIPAKVFHAGRASRMDSFENATGAAAEFIRELGLRSGVGVPIVVGSRIWGVAVALSSRALPPDTEARVGDFTDLVATAIANADARVELTTSRARIVAAADGARRRFERDLHDGAQQRLVSLGLKLRTAEAAVPPELPGLNEQLSDIVGGLAGVAQELQQISRGIHPAILSNGGLGPALKALGRRSAVPVTLDLDVGRRFPESAEVAAYYVVAEALTNVAKHAQASEVKVTLEADHANLYVSIQDDGVGGADLTKGSGLIGLKDRAEALGGRLQISSPPGKGTQLLATIPIAVDQFALSAGPDERRYRLDQ